MLYIVKLNRVIEKIDNEKRGKRNVKSIVQKTIRCGGDFVPDHGFFRAIGSCVCRQCGGFGIELGMESVFED